MLGVLGDGDEEVRGVVYRLVDGDEEVYRYPAI